MKAPEVSNKMRLYFFGILITLGGMVFGMSIALFNSFFDYFIKGCFPDFLSSKYDSIKTNLNFFYSIGFIPCTLVSGWFLERFGRKTLIVGLGIINIFVWGCEAIPNIPLLYVLRAISGI